MCGGALSNFVCREGGGIGEKVARGVLHMLLVQRMEGSKEECSQASPDENVWNSPYMGAIHGLGLGHEVKTRVLPHPYPGYRQKYTVYVRCTADCNFA